MHDLLESVGSGWTTAQVTVTVNFIGAAETRAEAAARFATEELPRTPDLREVPGADDFSKPDGASNAQSEVDGTTPAGSDDRKAHALLIGSNLVAFTAGFTIHERKGIVDVLTFARLAADAGAPPATSDKEIHSWFEKYFQVLTQMGFSRVEDKASFQMPKRGSRVATLLELGARVIFSALDDAGHQVLSHALRGLLEMPDDSPIRQVFNDGSRADRGAGVQTTMISRDDSGHVKLTVLAVAIGPDASAEDVASRQVRGEQVRLLRFTVGMEELEGMRERIDDRLSPYRSSTEEFVLPLPDTIARETHP